MRISDWSSDVCSSDLHGNATRLAALSTRGRACARHDLRAEATAAELKGEISMFTRFRSMPATAMAAVLGFALMATAAPASAQQQETPKNGEQDKEGMSARKEFDPAHTKSDEDTTA